MNPGLVLDSEADGFGFGSIFELESKIKRKIILEIINAGTLEDLKNLRLISKSFYEEVGNLFKTKCAQKYFAHFDGEKRSFVQSANFGRKLNGIYELDFANLKIARSEWYLLKVWLKLNNLSKIQTLVLNDNILNWQEIIQVLSKFPSIVNFKYCQTSNAESCRQIFNLFESQFKNFSVDSDNESLEKIHNYFSIQDIRGFLPNLKSFQMEIVHIKISNILAIIVSFGQCQLEDFSVKIDHMGMLKAIHAGSIVKFSELKIGWFKYLKKFASSLKNIELAIDSTNGVNHHVQNQIAGRIFEIFGTDDVKLFKEIESLVINIPIINRDIIFSSLNTFVQSLDKLKKFQLSVLTEQYEKLVPKSEEKTFKYLEGLVSKEENCKTFFDIYTSTEAGLLSIENLAGNVTKLEICPTEPCYLCREKIYINCKDLDISWNYINGFWPNFDVLVMCEKFPNLQKLKLSSIGRSSKTQAQLANYDLQWIIRKYPNLKLLELENCVRLLTDDGLTGFTRILTFPCLSISHLKDLEVLIIKSHSDQVDITDVSAFYAFEGMTKLKNLQFLNTKISEDGLKMIREKSKSLSLTISSENEIFEHIL